jgi:hypothetical protein
MLDAFVAMGGRNDKSGHVEIGILKETIQEFQLNTSVEKMLTEMDADQDGCVDFLEFTLILSQDSERSSEIFRYISNGEKLLSVDQLLRYTKVISQTWFVPESVIKRICESFVQEGISALNFEQFQQLVIERITMFQGQLMQRLMGKPKTAHSEVDRPRSASRQPSIAAVSSIQEGEIRQLSDLITLTLQKRQQNKYQQADDLMEALRSVLKHHEHKQSQTPKPPLNSPRSGSLRFHSSRSHGFDADASLSQTPCAADHPPVSKCFSPGSAGHAAAPRRKRPAGRYPGKAPRLPILTPVSAPAALPSYKPVPPDELSSLGNSFVSMSESQKSKSLAPAPPASHPEPAQTRPGRPGRDIPRELSLSSDDLVSDLSSPTEFRDESAGCSMTENKMDAILESLSKNSGAIGKTPWNQKPKAANPKKRAIAHGPLLGFLNPRRKPGPDGRPKQRPRATLRHGVQDESEELYLNSSTH